MTGTTGYRPAEDIALDLTSGRGRIDLPDPETTRMLDLLREVYRDGILPQVLKQKVWSAINGR